MKILPVQSKSFAFGEIESGYNEHFRDDFGDRIRTSEFKQAQRSAKLHELEKSVECKELNIFQKISYAAKKAKINRMKF